MGCIALGLEMSRFGDKLVRALTRFKVLDTSRSSEFGIHVNVGLIVVASRCQPLLVSPRLRLRNRREYRIDPSQPQTRSTQLQPDMPRGGHFGFKLMLESE